MRSRRGSNGFALWLTGMSGAGKTTLGLKLMEEMQSRNLSVELLDGDVVRKILGKGLSFSREDRITNLEQVAFVAGLLVKHGIVVICSFITPYEACRLHARENIEQYVEIYVKCNLEVLIQRDPKGLYKKALTGEIKNFTGITDPYEVPKNYDICVETDKEEAEQSFHKIICCLETNGQIPKSLERSGAGLT